MQLNRVSFLPNCMTPILFFSTWFVSLWSYSSVIKCRKSLNIFCFFVPIKSQSDHLFCLPGKSLVDFHYCKHQYVHHHSKNKRIARYCFKQGVKTQRNGATIQIVITQQKNPKRMSKCLNISRNHLNIDYYKRSIYTERSSNQFVSLYLEHCFSFLRSFVSFFIQII